jgi:hypothetical protein
MGKMKEIFMQMREYELIRDKHIDDEYQYEKHIRATNQQQPIKPKDNGNKCNK